MHGIVNLGLVESAIHRPYNGYYRRIERKAAADWCRRDSEAIDRAVEEMILSSVTKTMSLDDIVIWFKRRIRSAGRPQPPKRRRSHAEPTEP
jgi:hypothetical protein